MKRTDGRISRRVILILSLLGLLAVPPTGQAIADGTLPDGCLGSLSDSQVVVYYFHRKFRCQSCEVLESTLQSTLQGRYGDHFGNGRLAMCVINVDDPGNRHYLEQFQVLSNSVVIVEKRRGEVLRFKNLDALWDVSEDREAISRMLTREVAGFLPES